MNKQKGLRLVMVIGLLLVDNYWDKPSEFCVVYKLFCFVISVLGGS